LVAVAAVVLVVSRVVVAAFLVLVVQTTPLEVIHGLVE
jgi:hypothetical protein